MDPSSKIPEWSALALSATQQALRLDPNNSEAHVALGYAHYWFEFAWAAAQAEFERAYDLDPQNTDAVNALGAVAYNAGEWDKAQGIFRHLLLKDPLYAHGHEWLGQISVALHRYSEAEASYRRADEIYGSSDGLRFAELQLARGRPDDALAIYKKNKDDPTALGGVALSLHKLGRQEESNVAIAELERKYAGVQPCLIAKIHAGRGEPDAAFRWLDRALAQHDMELVHFRGDPDMQTLRSDPRYQVVLHKLHLPE